MISELASDILSRLDGVWSVQLFFRTWPYYLQRANRKDFDPWSQFDVVLSETLSPPELSPELQIQLEGYITQLWAMCIIYIEAVLESYLLDTIESLSLDVNWLPRQAYSLYEKLSEGFVGKYGQSLAVSEESECRLRELTETRHLWMHKGGIVDQIYLDRTKACCDDNLDDGLELKPALGQERHLSERYIKESIVFAKHFILCVDKQVSTVIAD